MIILGGGLVGCEEGLHLAMRGKDVTIIEMLGEVAKDANRLRKLALSLELEKYVRVVTHTKGMEVKKEGLVCESPDSKEVLYEADTVIFAIGYKAPTPFIEQLRNTASEFYYIGDCDKPQIVMEAIKTGYNTAMDL